MRHLAQITVFLFCAGAAPLAAKDTPIEPSERPPLGFFNGVYDQVGRSGAGELVDWKLLIREEEGVLVLRSCEGLKRMGELKPSLEGEDQRYFEGDGEFCFYAVDGGNYPVLICRAADGGLLTLFPDPMREPDSCE